MLLNRAEAVLGIFELVGIVPGLRYWAVPGLELEAAELDGFEGAAGLVREAAGKLGF